jgi:cation:H+ antiporter
VLAAVVLMTWLYRHSPVFQRAADAHDDESDAIAHGSRVKAVGFLVAGIGIMLVGAELIVQGVHMLVGSARLSETFLGMAVVGMGESLEETARMVTPARRGHPELAWGNVVGTVVFLLTFNLGLVALIHPLTADPLVLRFHEPTWRLRPDHRVCPLARRLDGPGAFLLVLVPAISHSICPTCGGSQP